MKILVLGCKTMREGVLAAAVFFIAGILMILAGAEVLLPNIAYMQQIVMLLGLLLLLFAPVILISDFLLSVLPGAKERMDKCEH